MKAEEPVVDYTTERNVIEDVCQVFPYVGVTVLSTALIVKAVDLSDLTALMVSSQDCDSFRVPHLVAEKQKHSLHGV